MLTRLAIVTAPALFVLLWSTGFIGARYGMPYIEPLTFLAVRMGFAVVIMAAIALLAGARRPNANEIGHSLVAGSLVTPSEWPTATILVPGRRQPVIAAIVSIRA
jgi:drug/metabolite transporter (DMT)-like permease